MLAKAPKLKPLIWDGTTISTQGLYSKIPLDVYHGQKICAGPSVSSSGLRRLFSKSPAHFYAEWSGNPNNIEPEDKPHFILGRAVHHLLLGEAKFSESFCAQPLEYPDSKTGEMKPWNNNSNYAKAWHEVMRNENRAVVTPAMFEQIKGMANKYSPLARHLIIRAGALNGMIEHSIIYQDKDTGLWVKVRPDAIPTSSVDFVDLKTTTSVLWHDLQRTIAECGYHAQGALVRSAARIVLGISNPTFSLVFVEKNPPYCPRIVTLKDNDLDRGEKQNRAALDTIAACLKSKHWPGPGGDREDAENIELPAYAQKQIDDKLEFGIA